MDFMLWLVNFDHFSTGIWGHYYPGRTQSLPLEACLVKTDWDTPFIVILQCETLPIHEPLYQHLLATPLFKGFVQYVPKALWESGFPSLNLLQWTHFMGYYTNHPMSELSILAQVKHFSLAEVNYKKKEVLQTKQLELLDEEISRLIHTMEGQLLFTKKKLEQTNHQRAVLYFSHWNFSYHYRVGVQSSSEYSDFIPLGNNQLLWLNFSCDAYSTSSLVLKFLEEFREKKNHAVDLMTFKNSVLSMVKSHRMILNHTYEFTYFFALLGAESNEMEFLTTGDYEIITSRQGKLALGQENKQISIDSSESFLLLTPGVKKNITNGHKRQLLTEFILQQLGTLKADIMPEVMLSLEHQDVNHLLEFDVNLVFGENKANELKSIN
jgi:hypothetical protein